MTTLDTTKSFEELNPRHDTPPELCVEHVPVEAPYDPVSAPRHYVQMQPEPIEVIESWGLDFHRAQVLKYVARAPHKDSFVEDLKKARWYLDRLIAIEEGR